MPDKDVIGSKRGKSRMNSMVKIKYEQLICEDR
jgi:hypothetical protein